MSGERSESPEVTVEDIFSTMEARVNPKGVEGVTGNYGYVITGAGGGEWTVMVADGTVEVREGLHDPHVTTTVSAEDWVAITLGELDPMTAFSSGRLRPEGDLALLARSTRFFKRYAPQEAAGEEEEPPREELIRLRQVLSISQRFATGPVMGRFLNALKGRRILANGCPSCGRRQLPPREVCAVCRVRATEWVEVGPEAEIVAYDVAYYASPDPLTGESRETPYCSVHVLPDGCKGVETLWHMLKPSDIERVGKGVRVRPVWSDERVGAITDIQHFEVL